MQLLRRFPILVMAAALVGLGLFGAWVYQSSQDDMPTTVLADPPWTDSITTTEHDDGHGIAHASRVNYSRTLNPFRATVHRVEYGGRRAEHFCTSGEIWRYDTTEYYQWSESKWKKRRSTAAGAWKAPPKVQMDYYEFFLTVIIPYGARVDNRLKFKHWDWCRSASVDYNSAIHRHYLE